MAGGFAVLFVRDDPPTCSVVRGRHGILETTAELEADGGADSHRRCDRIYCVA